MFELMLLPFLTCIVLVGIHAYLGFHVLERGVIFLDIALAQIASLGYLVAFSLHFPFKSGAAYFISLGLTSLGSYFLSWLRGKKVNQEAVIGVLYVVCGSLAILILNFAPSEAEHLKSMLVGNILFITWSEWWKIIFLYSLLGIFYFVFHRRFWLLSQRGETVPEVQHQKFWDFLFYFSFGLVVTSSVAGIFLVFAFLIMPPLAVSLFALHLKTKLFLAWLLGLLFSTLGLFTSSLFDLPTGAAIVCLLGLLVLLSLVLVSAVKKLRRVL